LLEFLDRKIELISENDGLTHDQTVDILAAIAKTPLWRGIKAVPDTFRVEKGIALEVDITDSAKENLARIEAGLQVMDAPPDGVSGFEVYCKDADGKIALIELRSGTLSDTAFGNLVSRVADVREVLGKHFRIIVLANDFTPAFVKAASQIPSLKLKKFSIKTDIKTKDVS